LDINHFWTVNLLAVVWRQGAKMMYKEMFVAVVKCDGKILRERDGVVTLPFLSEYTVLLKNLHTQDAVVKMTIDGADVLGGNSLVVSGNSETEVEGFLSGTVARNHFRFVEKTERISEYRGDRVDDGIIRVEWQFEKPAPIVMAPTITWKIATDPWYTTLGMRNSDLSGDTVYCSCSAANIPSCFTTSLAEEGITVKGSEANQQFHYASTGPLEEQRHALVLRLSAGPLVSVKTKLICSTCGTKSRSDAKYCVECGTYLS